MFSTYEAAQLKSTVSSLMLPLIAIVMNFVTTVVNFVGPVSRTELMAISCVTKKPRSEQSDKAQQYVLVTGCDRGFGYAMAQKLDDLGYSVLAGCLNADSEDSNKLREHCSSRLTTIQLDVTNEQDIKNVEGFLNNDQSGKELWGIVNNAGVCFVGTPEIMSWEDVSKIIDVNFRGTVNVTRTFLPFVRQSQGRVVNIGSINGEVPMPYFSIYCATKAAIKMFTEALAYEMQLWGVKVSLIAPAGFKTGLIGYNRQEKGSKWWASASDLVKCDYGKEFFNMPMRVTGRIKVSDDCGPVVDAVVHALTSTSPKPIYRPGHGGTMLPALLKFIPFNFRSYLCGSILNFVSSTPKALTSVDKL